MARQVSGARTRVFTNFVDATTEVLTSEAPSTASEVAMLKSGKPNLLEEHVIC
jgi:hypothetical protein